MVKRIGVLFLTIAAAFLTGCVSYSADDMLFATKL